VYGDWESIEMIIVCLFLYWVKSCTAGDVKDPGDICEAANHLCQRRITVVAVS
jgi:hypothetical protein